MQRHQTETRPLPTCTRKIWWSSNVRFLIYACWQDRHPHHNTLPAPTGARGRKKGKRGKAQSTIIVQWMPRLVYIYQQHSRASFVKRLHVSWTTTRDVQPPRTPAEISTPAPTVQLSLKLHGSLRPPMEGCEVLSWVRRLSVCSLTYLENCTWPKFIPKYRERDSPVFITISGGGSKRVKCSIALYPQKSVNFASFKPFRLFHVGGHACRVLNNNNNNRGVLYLSVWLSYYAKMAAPTYFRSRTLPLSLLTNFMVYVAVAAHAWSSSLTALRYVMYFWRMFSHNGLCGASCVFLSVKTATARTILHRFQQNFAHLKISQ